MRVKRTKSKFYKAEGQTKDKRKMERLQLFYRYSDAAPVQMVPGIVRRTLVSSDKLMICRFDLDTGAEIPGHAHPQDQIGYVVSGRVRITVAGKSFDLEAGDTYSAPSGVEHKALTLEKAVVVDTFNPPRDDYRTEQK
jgi:quercetin dioxygenase-like cupin family protein